MLATYIIVTVATFVIARWVKKFLAYRALFNNLPGETDFSYLTGTMHKIPGTNEEGLAYEYEMSRKYKYFHRVWAGPILPVLLLYHPDTIKGVLKSQAPKPRNKIIASAYDMGLRWLGEGLLIANGDRWARSRRLLTPAFHFDILKSYLDTYNKCSDILVNKISELSSGGKSVEIYSLINMHALDVILRCAFSYNSDCQTLESGNEYVKAISELQLLWSKRALQPHLLNEFIYSFSTDGKRFYKLCDIAHRVSEDVIEKRRKELEKDPSLALKKKVQDFLDLLLSAKDDDGHGLSPIELRNEADTFMFAGHDTTASAMTWLLYALAGHPEYQERVFDEITQLLGDRQDLEWGDLSNLEYTTMCIKEAIRLHGPVPLIERHTCEDLNMNGSIIPAGTRVALYLYVLHHNPHVWDEPHEFRPDRFHPDKQRHMDPFQYVPFSAGSRNCIGQNFAMNEMKTTIVKVIRKFKLSIDPQHKARRVNTVTMKPESGVYLHATPLNFYTLRHLPRQTEHSPKPRNKIIASAYDMGLRWLGEGLLIANGDRWARSRRLLTPAFHFDILKSYLDTYNKCSDILVNKISELSSGGKSVEIYSLINMHALDVILRCAFSYNSDCQTLESGNEYVKAISELQLLWSKRALQPHLLNEFIYSFSTDGKRFYKLCDIAHRVSEDVIEKRRKELEKDPSLALKKKVQDFLDLLLSAKDDDGHGLSPIELRNEADTFMFAGHDTTASAMTWLLYALAGHPEYQERVFDEITQLLGDRQDLEWGDLSNLEYTTMCIKEAIRLHGPVPLIERHTCEDLNMNGSIIPAGTRVALYLYVLHHNPHVWDEPHEFRPDRFHPDKQRHMDPFQYVPFSAGSRNCIGQNFAMNEMKTTIVKVIRKFKLSIDPQHKARRVNTVTMKPESGVYLHATPRI